MPPQRSESEFNQVLVIVFLLLIKLFVTNSRSRGHPILAIQCTEPSLNDKSKLVVSQLTTLPCNAAMLARIQQEFCCYIRESMEVTEPQCDKRQVFVTGKDSKMRRNMSSCEQPVHPYFVQPIEETTQHGAANYHSCREEDPTGTGSCCADETTSVLPFYTFPVQETRNPTVNDNRNQLVLPTTIYQHLLPNKMVTAMRPILVQR